MSLSARRQIGAFILGLLIPIAVIRWYQVPLAIAAVDQLAIVQDDKFHITISYPQRVSYSEIMEYRVRIPKYTYPSYHAFCSMWHHHAHQPPPPVEEAYPDSVGDY